MLCFRVALAWIEDSTHRPGGGAGADGFDQLIGFGSISCRMGET